MTNTVEEKATGQSSSSQLFAEVVRSEERLPTGSSEYEGNRLRVFLADDSRLVSERLMALLTTVAGVHIVGLARTVSGAIRGIQHLLPDLVILDFQLPDGNGLDVLKAIRPGAQPPLVIVFTNFSYPQCRAECLQHGAHYFFDKSQDFEAVVEVCKQLVSLLPSRFEQVSE